jgi:hypothetical protein
VLTVQILLAILKGTDYVFLRDTASALCRKSIGLPPPMVLPSHIVIFGSTI